VDLSSSIDPLIAALETGGKGFEFDPSVIFGGALSVTSAIFAGVIGFVTTAILTLVISVYLALTLRKSARDGAYSLVPVAFRPEMKLLGERIAGVWTDYLRGQLTVAVVVAVLTTVVMFALGVPGAMVLGVIGGLFNIIPTFGPIFASVVAALVALVQGSNHIDVSNPVFALIVVGVYAVIQQLESNLIAPRILGGAMSVSPLAILLGILIGFGAAGVLGAIIAVPVVASSRVIFLYIRAKLLDEDPFPVVEPGPKAIVGDDGIIIPADAVGAEEGSGELDAEDVREQESSIPPDL
jgi:predicted PurR-regulated permease PerM